MSTKKSTRTEAAAETGRTEVFDTIATAYTNGVQRLADVQKRVLDAAVKQNGEVVDSWKKLGQNVPGAPSLFMLDLAATTFERFAETQKGVIELIVDQSNAIADLMKERAYSAGQTFEGAPELVKQTVEQSVAAQKKALDYSAAQTKAAFESAKEQFGLAGTPAEAAAHSFQKGVDTLIESQKELLDIAAKPFAAIN